MLLEPNSTALVVAPHPDDEVLGAGGTIARLADRGISVVVAIATRAQPPLYDETHSRIDRRQAQAAHAILGVSRTLFLDLPAAGIGEVPHGETNGLLVNLMAEVAPDLLLLPHPGDIHIDHQRIFLSAMVAARPNRPTYPRCILAYETLSETNWNAPYLTPPFVPNTFVDITDQLERKLAAMKAYASELKAFPHERSLESIEALARLRGSAMHRPAAEAFVAVRQVW